MKQKMVVTIGLLIGSIFLFSSAGLAAKDKDKEKTKRQMQEEAKKTAEERAKQIEQLKKTQQLSEHILQQQRLILQQQKNLEETLERTRFHAKVVLEKGEVEADGAISFEFVLTNGSQKSFWIDGRKSFPPNYEIFNEKGKVVFTSQSQKNVASVKKKDLVQLKPGETLTLPKGEVTAPSKPGMYSLSAFYTFADSEEQPSGVWLGTIHAMPVQFRVIEKKN